jgi:hypothetical protein
MEIYIKKSEIWFIDEIGEKTVVRKSELTDIQMKLIIDYLNE